MNEDDSHRPIMDKLGYQTRPKSHRSEYHSEAIKWSKTGRGFIEMIQDFLRDLFL